MVQQDNPPDNDKTVDGRPIRPGKEKNVLRPSTKEYVAPFVRDDDPLLSETERASTRGDLLHTPATDQEHGNSHP